MAAPTAGDVALDNNRRYSPAAGVKTDFVTLLSKFAETNSVRYTEFATLWCGMKMSLIFAGRQEDRECREFIEECMNIAVSFWMPPYTFQARIGGLYLLYSLYVKQVVIPKVKIRLTLEHWSNVKSFLEEVKEQQHWDVEYIYHKLCFHRAFQFTATEKEKILELRDSAAVDDAQGQLLSEALTQRKSILSEVIEQEAIDHLSNIHKQYQHVKCLLAGPDTKKPHPSVDIIHTNLVQYITKAVSTHEEWQRKKVSRKYGRQRKDSGSTSESEEGSDVEWTPRQQPTSIGERRAQLKAKAFGSVSTASRSRRYRQVVKEETEELPGNKRGRKQNASSSESPWLQDHASPVPKKARASRVSEGTSRLDTPVETPAMLDIYAIGDMMASQEKVNETEPASKRKQGRPPKAAANKNVTSPQSSQDVGCQLDMEPCTPGSTEKPEKKVLPVSSGKDIVVASPRGKNRRPRKGRGTEKEQNVESSVINVPAESINVGTQKGRGRPRKCSTIKGKGRGMQRKGEGTNSQMQNN